MNHELKEMLGGRIGAREIRLICNGISDDTKANLYNLIDDTDERTGYNALWIFTHLSKADRCWLYPKRDELIDRLLHTVHTGKRRLLLTLLERQPTTADDIRPDYLDFCMAHINSADPYAIRALCTRQAFAQCRYYPELLSELKVQIDMMEYNTMSPALMSVKRNISKQIAAIRF